MGSEITVEMNENLRKVIKSGRVQGKKKIKQSKGSEKRVKKVQPLQRVRK